MFAAGNLLCLNESQVGCVLECTHSGLPTVYQTNPCSQKTVLLLSDNVIICLNYSKTLSLWTSHFLISSLVFSRTYNSKCFTEKQKMKTLKNSNVRKLRQNKMTGRTNCQVPVTMASSLQLYMTLGVQVSWPANPPQC